MKYPQHLKEIPAVVAVRGDEQLTDKPVYGCDLCRKHWLSSELTFFGSVYRETAIHVNGFGFLCGRCAAGVIAILIDENREMAARTSMGLEARPTLFYRLFSSEGEFIYCGITCNWLERRKAHSYKSWWSDVDESKTVFEKFDRRSDASDREKEVVAREKPRINSHYASKEAS